MESVLSSEDYEKINKSISGILIKQSKSLTGIISDDSGTELIDYLTEINYPTMDLNESSSRLEGFIEMQIQKCSKQVNAVEKNCGLSEVLRKVKSVMDDYPYMKTSFTLKESIPLIKYLATRKDWDALPSLGLLDIITGTFIISESLRD